MENLKALFPFLLTGHEQGCSLLQFLMLLPVFIMFNPELQNKTHSPSICRNLLTWGHYFAILLIQYGARQRAFFTATFIFLCPLDPISHAENTPCQDCKLPQDTVQLLPCQTPTSALPPLLCNWRSTVCEMREKANRR